METSICCIISSLKLMIKSVIWVLTAGILIWAASGCIENLLHLVLGLSDLQAITVRTMCGKEFELHVEMSRNVGYVKQEIAKKRKWSVDLKDQELICDGEELEDQRLTNDISKSNDDMGYCSMSICPISNGFEVSAFSCLMMDLVSTT